MNNVLYSTVSIGILGIAGYYGYVYGKNKFYKYVMGKVNEELDRRMEIDKNEELFKPVHKNSAVIMVNQAGKTHSVYVPYDRKKSTSMIRKKVYLIKDEEKLDISQKPGVPYLINAGQLGGTEIIVEDMSGDIIKRYSKDEIPNYLI